MNIRESACPKSYSEIIREERNFAAILYALLCRPENIEKFIALCGFDLEMGPDPGVYFEYSYLRDLWHQILAPKDKKDPKKVEAANNKKLKFINNHLNIKGIGEICKKEPPEFNGHFGVAGRQSPKHIQYPGKWSVRKLEKNFEDVEDRRKIAKFKWACNIKPDIVINLAKNIAICIETKYESGESVYPSNAVEKKILKYGNENWTLRQTDVQRYLIEDLLGYKARYLFINKSGKRAGDYCCISWKQAFEDLDLTGMINDVSTIIETCKKG